MFCIQACLRRGLNPFGLSKEEQLSYLDKWTRLSSSLTGKAFLLNPLMVSEMYSSQKHFAASACMHLSVSPDLSGQVLYLWMDFKLIVLLNPLPDNKILDWSKLKQIADDFKVHLKQKISTILGRKNCEKRRNCFYKQFLLFSQCFLQVYIFSASKCGNGLS